MQVTICSTTHREVNGREKGLKETKQTARFYQGLKAEQMEPEGPQQTAESEGNAPWDKRAAEAATRTECRPEKKDQSKCQIQARRLMCLQYNAILSENRI